MDKANKTIKAVFILSLMIITSLNLFHLSKNCFEIHKKREKVPYSFVGNKFSGLEKVFKGIEYVGYYTDKDVTLPENNMQYSQAQFILTPTILEINNTNHRYTLFDCSSEEVALKKIDELNLTPLKKNIYGIILAQR